MSDEFSFPPNTTNININKNSKKTANFFSLLLSDLFLLSSFIISHPLYFSYFIFFSPYIINILSFLSPLFITTSLLLLSLLTTFVHETTSCTDQSCEKSKASFLLSTYHNAVDKLSPNADDADGVQSLHFEYLEAYYKILFDTCSNIEIRDDDDEVSEAAPIEKHMCHESLDESVKEDDGDACKKSEKEVKPLELLIMSSGSKTLSKMRVDSQRLGDGDDHHVWGDENDGEVYKWSSMGSYGSMRKEKEWRRTLACKLYEERHNNNNVEGSEGMDMLWETYEADSKKQQQHLLTPARSKTKKGKKCSKYEHHHDDDDDDDDDDGKLCCLQALKFSAGKMNLGMGRPNLVKISKAFKGIEWLHIMTKHGKRIYH